MLQDKLIRLIEEYRPLGEEAIKELIDGFEPILEPAHTLLEEAGWVPRYLYFIVSGHIRLFHYDAYGDEATSHIDCPPGFITSYQHFTNRTRSDVNVQTITECTLLRITKTGLDNLMDRIPAFKDFSIRVFERSLAYQEERCRDLATLSAADRYKKLIEAYPDIVRRVPVQYIASFLGIKPESLSRIRRQLS